MIFTAKTFRIKRVNRDFDDFATNTRKNWIVRKVFWIAWKVFGLSGEFGDCLDNFWIVRTIYGLSRPFLDCSDSFGIVRKVSGLSGQFLDCPDSF